MDQVNFCKSYLVLFGLLVYFWILYLDYFWILCLILFLKQGNKILIYILQWCYIAKLFYVWSYPLITTYLNHTDHPDNFGSTFTCKYTHAHVQILINNFACKKPADLQHRIFTKRLFKIHKLETETSKYQYRVLKIAK